MSDQNISIYDDMDTTSVGHSDWLNTTPHQCFEKLLQLFAVMRFGSSKYPHTIIYKHIKMQIALWTQHDRPIPLWWLKFTHHTGGTPFSFKLSICRSCKSWEVQSDVIPSQRPVKEMFFGGGSLKCFSSFLHFALYFPNV